MTALQAGIATAAVGMITAPAQADEIIRNERADLVLLALLRNIRLAIAPDRRIGCVAAAQ